MVNNIKLVFGKKKQLKFVDESDFYKSLGMVCNPDTFTITYEPNKRTGSYADAYRIRKLSTAGTLTSSLENAIRTQGRINCNEYIEYLIDNFAVVEHNGDILLNISEITKSIPDRYLSVFMEGYKHLKNETADAAKVITYTVEAGLNLSCDLKLESVPKKLEKEKQPEPEGVTKITKPKKKIDYLVQQLRNAYIGDFGEEKVFMLEKAKLAGTGFEPIWKSKIDDSLGYDILSYTESGEKMYIEVKSTPYGPRTPFFMSSNEISKSKELKDNYYVYRVYNLKKNAESYKYFVLKGDVSTNDRLFIESLDSMVHIK